MSIEDLNLEYEYFLNDLYRVHRLLHEIMELVNQELGDVACVGEKISPKVRMLEGNFFYLSHYELQLRDLISEMQAIIFTDENIKSYEIKPDNIVQFPYIYDDDEVMYIDANDDTFQKTLSKLLKKRPLRIVSDKDSEN